MASTRRIARRLNPRAWGAIGLFIVCLVGAAAGAKPPLPTLPTPCLAGNCGSSAQSFVTYGAAGASVSGNVMNITQTTANAVLNWANFNIASGYKVNFLQPSATAEVLNNIWSANPSVIAGALNANGQVYLYNQNGIVFDKGAQINVGGLTASTLNFAEPAGSTDPDALFKNGILSNNGNAAIPGTLPAVFQTSAATTGSGGYYSCTPAPCTVSVQPGAQLTAADGGRIMLLGQAVSNQGTISTPDGQAILAAGNTVYLAASTDPSLRGLLIEVNAGGTGSSVTNQGEITAPRGNVTLAGMIVNQEGTVSATTSVSANGSIYLVAGDTSATDSTGQQESYYNDNAPGFGTLLPNQGGQLTLAPGSLTEVLPDTTSTATVSEQNLVNFIPSQVAMVGQSVTLQGNASVRAPGATVLVNAATNPSQQFEVPGTAYNDGGRIYLASGSSIDVSGLTDVPVAATNEIIQVTLEGDDLQNDPLLRNGFLHGTTVTVNANQGSTLFSVAPYTGNIQVGIDQVLTAAGSIQLNSDGDVIARAGSTLNVSGGSIAYQGGYGPATTKLLAANGEVYGISDAPNDIQYVSVASSYSYTDPTWGVATSVSAQTYYPGYTQGANAGEIEVLGPEVYLRGSMLGSTVAGLYQRTSGTLAQGGLFELGCNCKNSNNEPDYRAPAVLFTNGATDILGSDFDYADLNVTLPAALQSVTTLSPAQLADSGFSRIAIYSNGVVNPPAGTAVNVPANTAVYLPAGTDLNLAAGGSLTITTDQSIAIDGNISIAGSLGASGAAASNTAAGIGNVFSFISMVDATVTPPGAAVSAASAVTLTTQPQSSGDVTAHNISLGAGAVINVSGSWVNDSPLLSDNASATAPIAINGGNVTLNAGNGNVVLGTGSRIDVSGGGWINDGNQLTPGSAGAINLSASFLPLNDAPYQGSVSIGTGAALLGAGLVGGAGGSLSISSGSVTVGWSASGTPGELLLSPDFFANRGFASYSITGQNDVIIGSAAPSASEAVTIAPIQESLVFTQDMLLKPTGSNVGSFTALEELPQSERSPASVSFTSTGYTFTGAPDGTGTSGNGTVLLAQNASIITDPLASVSLTTDGEVGSITVLGTILAPAGDITLQLGSSKFDENPSGEYVANQQIVLGPQALLAAPAYAEINTLDPLGYRQGSVLAGGTISLQANKGYVVTDPGSVIDVSGTAAVIDVVSSNGVTPTVVAGNAGNIDIDAREGIVLQGNLRGQAATFNGSPLAGAGGGALSLGIDLFDYGTTVAADAGNTIDPFPLSTRTLTLSSPADYVPSNQLQSGTAQISTATIAAGGFDSVTLKSADVIYIEGAVSLSAAASLTLDAPVLQGNPGASLHLNSAYVALGNYYNQQDYFDTPTSGGGPNPNVATVLAPNCGAQCTATLSVNAQQIDIRGISGWSGFSSENLASSGDIRLTSAQNPVNTPPALETAPGDTSEPSLRSALDTTGNLTLQAQQIYPTTNTDFTITSGSSVTIASSPGTGSAPLSAGGILTINAPSITQGGVLRAPMGEITLNAVNGVDSATGAAIPGSVTLTAGSVTSVSANGLVIPYGSTVNGQQWTYSPDSLITEVINAPPAKAVNLNGADVSVNKGATVDLSGGGDLYAYEFIAGEGGSQDVLSPANAATGAYTYAILPSLGSAFSPIDSQYQTGSKATGNQTIYVSGVPGLAAGVYALLPAYYALLPGAYAVQIEKADSGIVSGPAVQQGDGAYLAAARFGVAGTTIADSLNSTVLIAPDSVVRTQSQYTDTYANAFFSAAAAANQTAIPSLPADAGDLQISATGALALNGKIVFATGSYESGTTSGGSPITVQGSGGAVSIEAPNILVVDSATPAGAGNAAGALQVNAQSLDALGAQTVVLGATTQNTTAGEVITAGATQGIELDNTAVALTASEIVLAAQNTITLDPGAEITAKGTLDTSPTALVLQGAGALLRASSGAAAPLTVETSNSAGQAVPQNPAGLLSVGAGASVTAGGSLLLYSTGDTTAQPGATISAPALGLYSSRVSLGDVPTGKGAPGGLDLSTQLLGELTGLTALTIGSTSTIDMYGTVNLGTPNSANPGLAGITLEAWAVDGYGTGNKTLQAGAITLQNSNVNPNADTTTPASVYSSSPSGTGSLTLLAEAANSTESGQITLGTGKKTLAGFSAVNLDAEGDIQGQGTGTLNVGIGNAAVPLTLQSAALTAASASTQSIVTAGAVTMLPAAPSKVTLPAAPLGGELSIEGSSIAQNGVIDLPAGIITLQATSGDVDLGKGSITGAAGSAQNFVVTDAVAAGGQISLVANAGNVVVLSGATIDVSGTSSPNGKVSGGAGSLTVSAPQGTFQFAGATLQGGAPAGQMQGNLTLDENSGLGGTGFAALASSLSNSGFTGALSLQTGGEAVNVGNITASSFELSTSNQGSIAVSGTINTSGGNALDTDGGAIQLWAGTGLTLESGAQLLANAGAAGPVGVNGNPAPAQGGSITLGTAAGYLTIDGGTAQHPTLISMQGGGAAGTDGTLTLRAPRTADDSNVQIQVQNAPGVIIVSRQAVVVEGFKAYSANDLGSTDSGCGTGGSCDIADLNGILFSDAATFEANAPAIVAGLGLADNVVQVRPGIEIDSTGDLVLDNSTAAWDLDSWNAALGAPINLTLRAAGNLIFNSSLSDGFTNDGQSVADWSFGESAADVDSASYRLTAGANLTAANPLAVITQPISTASTTGTLTPNAGNVIVTPGNLIRTGDGSIDIAAGGDVLLGYNYSYDSNGNLQAVASNPLSSVIYTAGIPSTLTPVQAALFTPPTGNGRDPFTASYPTDGGNISVAAADDIMSAPSEQLASDWLWRQGTITPTGVIGKNTTWWVVFGNFEQGIGALGGGNVSLTAGRNIVNVSAVIPSTGELLGLSGTTPLSSNLLVYGAGNLQVQAGGNIESGVFEDDWGNASISAGGALTSGTTLGAEIPAVSQQILATPLSTPLFPVLLVGIGTFDVSARTGVTVNSVGNSTTTPLTISNSQASRPAAYYFIYGPSSALNIVSSGGDVVLQNESSVLPVSLLDSINGGVPDLYALPGEFGYYYPPVVNIAALSGNISVNSANGGLNMFPSATGNLSLLAQGSITGASAANPSGILGIQMYETAPASWPNPLAPQSAPSAPANIDNTDLPQQPLYQNETQPVYIVADTGSISAADVTLPKAADVIAGGNITDLNYAGKNLNPSDVTLIEAGGNISYSTPTAPLTNQLLQNPSGILLAGPGYLEVLAGGSLNLGDSAGIVTTGNLTDPRLPSNGASLIAGAGFGSNSGGGLRQPAYESFIDSYLAPDAAGTASIYASALSAYMQQLYPLSDANLSYGAALTAFEALTPAQQLPLLSQVLSDVLSTTGLAHTTQGASYAPGFAAINTLFPVANAQGNALSYQGDIDMFYSQLKTEQGGNINLLVPGGSVIVGVPNPSAALNGIKATTTPTVAAAANLGILVLGQGAIEGFADQNYEVNQSRILTLEGGDIILWASNGSIDAGNGAKSASGAPPPVVETSSSGTVFVNPVNDVSGSGIGQLLTGPNETAGLVNLIAPNGDVNAGDAGIRVAGNLNIAAVQVIGAGNITVVGTSTGVPVSEAGALAGPPSGANSLGDASKNAVEQLSQDLGSAANYQQLTDNLQPTFITVKMFCLGVQCEAQ
jgi:filamentous hemagglutinin